jgi:hypothetical protein
LLVSASAAACGERKPLAFWKSTSARRLLRTRSLISPTCFLEEGHLVARQAVRDVVHEALALLEQGAADGVRHWRRCRPAR